MSELTALQERLAGLIASLSPAARRQMAADIAKKLRASQQQRIRRQQAPDGTPYAARKRQPVRRSKKGRIRREMFARLRTNRFMKAKGSDSAAVVEFTGRVQRMARVHQYGLKDRPNRHSRDVQYAARPLLGFTRDDEQMIEDIIIRHLGK
ncbi:phage virion morphogenesis protein [Salmonella enterica]|nr:phage virion morphogenesis protein [Salmonella enterica subsp. enterica serovar Newport]EAN8256446.1 phage virion morphogenesis protein [Salmonella enterica]EBH0213651.1 phage virion morphogenesis protein [Salmonella enterica]EBS2364425.1 phage virion morphogenesis protein [Salmonella enterica subsp. enterica serovar Newport]EBS4395039.1 phage virion morphogenesis protein [Salmonella enterica subsp. enterica serovar Newport]